MLLLLFVVDFFHSRTCVFLVINYVSADAVAASLSLYSDRLCVSTHTFILDHLSSIFGLHASIAERPKRRVAKLLCDFGNFLGTRSTASVKEEKLEMFFLTKLYDIFTALFCLFCRALNANIFVAGLVSSWADWEGGIFLSVLDLGFHLEKFENLYKLHKW